MAATTKCRGWRSLRSEQGFCTNEITNEMEAIPATDETDETNGGHERAPQAHC